LSELALQSHRPRDASRAVRLLEPMLQSWPDDVQAWESKGNALLLLEQPQEALRAFEKALEIKPRREISLIGAAVVCTQLQKTPAALRYWNEAIAVNPWNWKLFHDLASLLAGQQRWKAAAKHCQKALELNPTSLDARKLLIECYLHLNDLPAAQAEFDHLQALDPDPQSLRRWFDDLQRQP
jgi:tetratricopeptide (TPR) repeat protein